MVASLFTSSENVVEQVLPCLSPRFTPFLRPSPPMVAPLSADKPVSIVWFRGHDLRVHDHAALDAAVKCNGRVVALYTLEMGEETDGMASFAERCKHSNRARNHDSDTMSSSSQVSHASHSASSASSAVTDTSPVHFNSSDMPSHRIPVESERGPLGPLSPNGGFALGRVQSYYLHHSLLILNQQLAALGITLVLRRVDCAEQTADCVTSVALALNAGAVFWNKRYKPQSYPVDEAVKSSLRNEAVRVEHFDSETLIPPDISMQGHYDDFHSYTSFWISSNRLAPPPRPSPRLTKATVTGLHRYHVSDLLAHANPITTSSADLTTLPLPTVHHLGLLHGLNLEGLIGMEKNCGCVAAEQALDRFTENARLSRFADPKCRRDGMLTGHDVGTSRLSPHVRFGEISPRRMFYAVVDTGAQAKKLDDHAALRASQIFLKNMSLREFGYYMLSRYPSAAYKPIVPEFEAFPWQYDESGALTRAWETGTTGFPIVDAAMRQLLREGWLHNRMRFLAASFFCKYLLLPWPIGAAHMVRTLVDGDEACNTLGWQWTAGCNSDSFPFSTLVNPLSLYAQTQSRKKAAEYVRKYVPELSMLPDSLIFTPWKATAEDRKMYNLNIIPLQKYNGVMSLKKTDDKQLYYPVRLVTGKDARQRARGAMEVMRRIFAAQRQCRTFLTDHSRFTIRARQRVRSEALSCQTKKKRRIAESGCIDPDGNRVVQLDITEMDDDTSYVSDVSQEEPKQCRTRARSTDSTVELPPSAKRQRIESDHSDVMQTTKPLVASPLPTHPETPLQTVVQVLTQEADRFCQEKEQAILPTTSSPPVHFPQRAVRKIYSDDQNVQQITKEQPLASTHVIQPVQIVVDSNRDNAIVIPIPIVEEKTSPIPHMPVRHSKRPRPSTPQMGKAADDRLSVKSLLSPNLSTHEITMRRTPDMCHHSPTLLQALPHRGQVGGLPKLAQVASYHPGFKPNAPATPDLLMSLPMGTPQRVAETVFSSPLPPNNMVPQPALARCQLRNPNENLPNHHQTMPSPRPDSLPRMDTVPCMPTQSMQGLHGIRKREPAAPVQAFDVRRAAQPSAVFHPNVTPMPLLTNQFQPQQHHNPQMMVPFRPPANTIAIPHLNHSANHLQAHGAAQGYFGGAPMGAHAHQAGQQYVWYPAAIPPFVDLRGAAMANPVMPQVIHPIGRQAPHVMPLSYPMPIGTTVNGQPDASRVVPGSVHMPFPDTNNGVRKGPCSILERENIARRMAAMDYHDENLGGKHWEQWQAISLHLLNQYEFSEDTDRETSKAYVRLCVLKDELRDANPNGPRVTVNHCKEVFRILNLPVTGEWDRRGHGGVRGPYVYGCVKRIEAQVSRR